MDVTTQWDPSQGIPDPPSAPTGSDGWEYVDPKAYSDPATESPVYTSGVQQAPPAPDAGHAQFGLSPSGPPLMTPPQPMDSPHAAPPPTGGVPGGPSGLQDETASADFQPGRGDLKIKERRSWHTWQLLLVACIAAVIGMALNSAAGPNASPTAASGAGTYKLPPAAGTGGTTTTVPAGSSTTGAAGASTTTTGAAGVTTTTIAAPGGATATPAPATVGPATVLVPATQLTGNWTSPAFTIAGGTWNVGWAFQCVPVPTAPPSFQIFVVNNGGAPSGAPAVTSSDATGNSVTPLTSTGSQQIIVQAGPTCRWAVKVTGSSS